jgi:hypothetical protein
MLTIMENDNNDRQQQLSTKVTDEDKKNGVNMDGALYSPDGLRLLRSNYKREFGISGYPSLCSFWSNFYYK